MFSFTGKKNSSKYIASQKDIVEQRKMTATKFNKFLAGAIRESRQEERLSMQRGSIQRRVASITNGSFLEVEGRSSSKLEQSHLNMINKLNMRVRQESIVANDFINKIDQQILDDEYYAANLKQISLCQRLMRGKRVRKNIAKQMKNHRYRKFVILELLTTESGYTHDILLFQIYALQLLKDSGLVKQEHIDVLVGNLDELVEFHKTLIGQLNQVPKDDFNQIMKVGLIYQKHIEGFKKYFKFSHNYNKAETLMKELRKNPKLDNFLVDLKSDPKLRFLGWEGFIVKPIQRLPKYILFLNDFLKHCEPDNKNYELFHDLQKKFLSICEQNNQNIHSLANSIKLMELEKYYGEPNQLYLMNKTYIREDKINFLIEGAEKHMLVHIMTDLILVCEPDSKEETGYRLYKYAQLSEHSYCQSISNKRYFSNLTKLITRNVNLTIISPTPEAKQQLIDSINTLISNLRVQSNKLPQDECSCPYQIDVQVIGTEERAGGTIMQYTLYVVKVTIGRVITDIFLRYSEIKGLSDLLQKEQSDHQFPQIKTGNWTGNWMGNKESKIIEQRKLEIEDFVQCLLVSQEFYNLEKSFQQKYLSMLGLESNFYEQPQMLVEVERLQPPTPTGQKPRTSIFKNVNQSTLNMLGVTADGKINAGTLIKLYSQFILNDQSQSTLDSIILTPRNVETLEATIMFHNGKKLEFKMPSWFRGNDLVQEVAKKIGLQDACDFRLFETDETQEKFRLILDDELMEQLLKKEKGIDKILSFFKKKVLFFRKYLFFPRKYEEIQQNLQGQGDRIRLELVLSQALFDIKRKFYLFTIKDYCMIVAFDLIYSPPKTVIQKSNFSFDWVKKIVPETFIKEQSKSTWLQSILGYYSQFILEISQISLLGQRLSSTEDGLEKFRVEQELEEKFQTINKSIHFIGEEEDIRSHFFQIQEGKTIVAAIMLLNLISQNKNYGMALYAVQVDQLNHDILSKLIKGASNKTLRKSGLSLGISIDGLAIFDELRHNSYMHVRFDEIDVEAHSDQMIISFDERCSKIVAQQSNTTFKDQQLQIVFNTQQGFQIVRLIQEYEYLQDELIQIDSM